MMKYIFHAAHARRRTAHPPTERRRRRLLEEPARAGSLRPEELPVRRIRDSIEACRRIGRKRSDSRAFREGARLQWLSGVSEGGPAPAAGGPARRRAFQARRGAENRTS